jgi:hypothetical protein
VIDKNNPYYDNCRDCGNKPIVFMLSTKAWRESVPEYTCEKKRLMQINNNYGYDVRFVLCYECTEKRLGRKIDIKDLHENDPLCNKYWKKQILRGK